MNPDTQIKEWREKILKMLNLQQDWDTYGADPITQPTVQKAISFIERVGITPKEIVPAPDGSIEIEWEGTNVIEISIHGAIEDIEYMILDKRWWDAEDYDQYIRMDVTDDESYLIKYIQKNLYAEWESIA